MSDSGLGDDSGDLARRRRRWLPWPARHEPRLEDIGSDLDPRYTFANERTFLAGQLLTLGGQ